MMFTAAWRGGAATCVVQLIYQEQQFSDTYATQMHRTQQHLLTIGANFKYTDFK